MRIVNPLAKLVLAFFATILGVSLASALAAAVMRSRLPDDTAPEDDDLMVNVVYDGREFRSRASALRGGRVVCWFAGADVDLRGATLDPAGASLEVWTVFGGTQLRVPEGWAVRILGRSLFGAAENATTSSESLDVDAPSLTVRHRTLFGGLSVEAAPDA